jgi:hypothetical protein
MSVWSWLATGIVAWTGLAFAVAVAIGRALRDSNDLAGSRSARQPSSRSTRSSGVANHAIVGAP